MADLPDAAIQAAARVLGNDCHGGPPDENDKQLAADVLGAAWPHLAEAVANAIIAHADSHGPRKPRGIAEVESDGRHYIAWHRHLRIAAQVAGLAFFTEDELKQQTIEAIKRGDVVVCDIPEVPE